MTSPLFPLSYEQTTFVAAATESKAESLEAAATALMNERSSSDSREANGLRAKRADLWRKRAAELRLAADKLWAFRRELPDAPMYAPDSAGEV